eukprot:TRINITY_DN74965_c0_g1_i1.p1 TRINITY_DN74965_c0_g1~~TRINITY_DN74965_c0_g1_i1.p1  ORF type:complete len:489 (+),score=124.02 TRINITY_DN74965_c0_g1_i1:75-1541(+)
MTSAAERPPKAPAASASGLAVLAAGAALSGWSAGQSPVRQGAFLGERPVVVLRSPMAGGPAVIQHAAAIRYTQGKVGKTAMTNQAGVLPAAAALLGVAAASAAATQRAVGRRATLEKTPPTATLPTTGELLRRIKDRKTGRERLVEAARLLRENHLLEERSDYRNAIGALTRRNAWEDALLLWDEMLWIGIPPEQRDFVLAMTALTKGGCWQGTLDLLNEIKAKGTLPDAKTYTAAISACRAGEQLELAIELLNEMETSDILPDVIAYNAVLSVCENCQEYEAAEQVFKEMQRWGVIPDERSYTTMISACGWNQKWERALDLLKDMRTTKLQLDLVAYTAAITSCSKAAKWEASIALLCQTRWKHLGRNVRTINGVMAACVAAEGRADEALTVLDDALEEKIKPNLVTYNLAVSACAQGKQWWSALRLVSEMQEQGINPRVSTLSAALSACEAAPERHPGVQALEQQAQDAGFSQGGDDEQAPTMRRG